MTTKDRDEWRWLFLCWMETFADEERAGALAGLVTELYFGERIIVRQRAGDVSVCSAFETAVPRSRTAWRTWGRRTMKRLVEDRCRLLQVARQFRQLPGKEGGGGDNRRGA
jgi:transposase